MSVTASIVVQFGKDADAAAQGVLQAEVDSRAASEGGRNVTNQFIAGDDVYYLVYKTDNVLAEQFSSAGSVSLVAIEDVTIEEFITFANSNEANTSKPIKSLGSVQWYGNNLGSVVSLGGNTIRAGSVGVGVAKVTYTAEAQVWKLSSPAQLNGEDNFSIVIVIVGTVE